MLLAFFSCSCNFEAQVFDLTYLCFNKFFLGMRLLVLFGLFFLAFYLVSAAGSEKFHLPTSPPYHKRTTNIKEENVDFCMFYTIYAIIVHAFFVPRLSEFKHLAEKDYEHQGRKC